MMVVCLGYCFGPMILATKLSHVPGVVVVAGATAFVADLVSSPWSVAHWPSHVSGETWSCMAVLSVVCTATAFLVFFELVKEVGSSRSVVVTYFQHRHRRRPGCRRTPRGAHLGHRLGLPARAGGLHLRHEQVPGTAVVGTTRCTERRRGPVRRPPSRVTRGRGRSPRRHRRRSRRGA